MMLEKESAVSFVYGYVNDFDSNRDDFSELEAQLRDQRATPTTDELNRVKRRATAGDVRPRTFTLARLAMVSLVSGAVLVGGSAASLALSGPSGDGSAGRAQYPTTTGGPTTTTTTTGGPTTTTTGGPTPLATPNQGGVLPNDDQGGCSTSTARSSQTNCPEDDTTPSLAPDESGVAPAADSGGDEPNAAQETRQVATGGGDGRLPFTGLLALPLMLVGVVMLGAGFALRGRAAAREG